MILSLQDDRRLSEHLLLRDDSHVMHDRSGKRYRCQSSLQLLRSRQHARLIKKRVLWWTSTHKELSSIEWQEILAPIELFEGRNVERLFVDLPFASHLTRHFETARHGSVTSHCPA